jgi:hypothetical protein
VATIRPSIGTSCSASLGRRCDAARNNDLPAGIDGGLGVIRLGKAPSGAELPRPRRILRQPDSHDGCRGLLAHRGNELEILRRVEQTRPFGTDDDEAGQAAAPPERHDHASYRKGLCELNPTPVEVSLQHQWLQTDSKLCQQGNVVPDDRCGLPEANRCCDVIAGFDVSATYSIAALPPTIGHGLEQLRAQVPRVR